MRIVAYLKTPKEVPIYYRSIILGIIKKALELEDYAYFRMLYNAEKSLKPFTFALLFNKFFIEGDMVKVEGISKLIISTGNTEFGIKLYSGLLKLKNKKLGATSGFGGFEITNVVIPKSSVISTEKVLIKTLSPIVVVTKDKKPILPKEIENGSPDNFVIYDTEKFNEELNYISSCALKKPVNIRFTPVSGRKVVVKHRIGSESNPDSRTIRLVAFKGTFYLEGNPEELNELYRMGIGFRRSQGFGCVEVVQDTS